MDTPTPPEIRLYVRIGDEIRGPYSAAQLRSLGEVGVVNPTTAAAAQGQDHWTTLGALPCASEIFPPRPELGFRETSFIPINRPGTPPVDHRELIAFANQPLSSEAAARVEKSRFEAPAAAPNDVEVLVRNVRDVEARFAPPLPPPPKRKISRDFKVSLALSLAGTAGLLALPLKYDFNDALGLSWPILFVWVGLLNAVVIVFYMAARNTRK